MSPRKVKRKGTARDQNFAVRLDNYSRRHRGQVGEICPYLTLCAEGSVARAVQIVADNCKILV